MTIPAPCTRHCLLAPLVFLINWKQKTTSLLETLPTILLLPKRLLLKCWFVQVRMRQDLGKTGVEDMIQLSDLNEASLLWNLRLRLVKFKILDLRCPTYDFLPGMTAIWSTPTWAASWWPSTPTECLISMVRRSPGTWWVFDNQCLSRTRHRGSVWEPSAGHPPSTSLCRR